MFPVVSDLKTTPTLRKGQNSFGGRILKLLKLAHFKKLILSVEDHCGGWLLEHFAFQIGNADLE